MAKPSLSLTDWTCPHLSLDAAWVRTTREDLKAAHGDVEPDWIRYGRAVTERRAALGLTQEQVTALGGPSTASLRLIEGALQQSYRPHTLHALDRALGWAPGSHLRLLAGGEAQVLLDSRQETVGPADGKPEETEQRPVGRGLDAEAEGLTPEQVESVRAVIRAMKPTSENV